MRRVAKLFLFAFFFVLPSIVFGATNIVTNGTFSPSSAGWTIVQNGGNGCAFGGAVTASYDWCIVSQTIDLASATGHSNTELDTALPMTFSLQYYQRGDKTNTKYFVEVKLLATDGTTVIASSLFGSQASPLTISSSYDQWNTITSSLSSYGAGARYAFIKIGGDDGSPNWGGYYGPAFKNVSLSIDDTSAPIVSSLNPSDNATGVSTSTNLVLNFNEAVNVETGNIVIKKLSDDSIFETIGVTSGNVTGSGSATITINPTGTFTGQTDYYVEIDATAFDDTSHNSYAGITGNTIWNFTTEDTITPILSNITAYTSSSGAIITWDTNENTSALVNYGLTSDTSATTSESDLSPRDSSHSVSISSLISCTRYYYKAESTDGNNNIGYSSVGTFKTTGCTGDSTITATEQSSITSISGGSVVQDNISLNIPTSFKNSVSSAIFQINKLDNSSFSNEARTPSGLNQVGDDVYTLKALTNENTNISVFDSSIDITMAYLDNDLSNLDESSLWIHRYDGSSWHALSNCVVDQVANTVTCETTAFSDFAIFGNPIPPVVTTNSNLSNGAPIPVKAEDLPGYVKPRPQIIYPDGKVVYLDTVTDKPKEEKTLPPLPSSKYVFTKNLKIGIENEEVKKLQIFLNQEGILVSSSGNGGVGNETEYFGEKTKKALIRFQEKYSEEILIPLNLTKGTGIFGKATRDFINSN